jgi:hypothetical protein
VTRGPDPVAQVGVDEAGQQQVAVFDRLALDPLVMVGQPVAEFV